MNGPSFLDKLRSRWHTHARLRKPVFLHIPKTGGTYLNQAETRWQERQPVLEPMTSLGHATLIAPDAPRPANYPPQGLGEQFSRSTAGLRRCFVVSTVRNPFDWLVSYAGHAGGWTPRYNNPDHYDYALAHNSFGDLVKAIADREDPWPSRRFLFMQPFSTSGELMVDWFCQNESLDDDAAALARAKRLIYRRQPRQRVGVRRDYRTYYTAELIDLVYQTWGRELALYGYGFDGPTGNGLLTGRVSKAVKQGVRYTWADDQLTLDPGLGWSLEQPAPAQPEPARCA